MILIQIIFLHQIYFMINSNFLIIIWNLVALPTQFPVSPGLGIALNQDVNEVKSPQENLQSSSPYALQNASLLWAFASFIEILLIEKIEKKKITIKTMRVII